MTDPTMLKRLSLALYHKAASLGLDVDPEGCGDLSPSTVLVMAVLEEMKDLGPQTEAKGDYVYDQGVIFIWDAILNAIQEGK